MDTVDAAIPLAINPSATAGPSIQSTLSLYEFAQKLKAQKEQQQAQNALKAVYQQPDAIDQTTGLPTKNALARISQIDPAYGAKLYDQVAQADEREARAGAVKAGVTKDKLEMIHGVASSGVDAYDAAIADGMAPAAAREAAQKVYSQNLAEMKKSGLFSADEIDRAPTEFDPVATRANAGKTKEYLDRIDKKKEFDQKEADRKETLEREDRAEKERERADRAREAREAAGLAIEKAKLGIEQHREARETAAASEKPSLSPAAIEITAEQVLAGDKSGLQNMGRGKQGAADLAAVRNRVAELGYAKGLRGADLANIDAAFKGQVSGEQALGRRGAMLDQAGQALDGIVQLSKQAYAKLPRGQFVPFNKLQSLVSRNLSSPEQAAAYQYDEAVINAWAKSISPTGNLTVSDVKRGEEMLSKVTDNKAHDAVLDAMLKETQVERKSNTGARANLREQGSPKTLAPNTKWKYDPKTGDLVAQ